MAEYLELARVVIERREITFSADTATFHLNEQQCTHLWRNLRGIYDYICGTLSYIQPTWLGFRVFKEFYLIVTRADAIPQQCSSARSWLQAAVFQDNHRQAIKQLTLDLQDWVQVFQETIKSLFSMLISNSDDILRLNVHMDGDYETDLTNLRTRLQTFISRSFSGNEDEKQLAEYIVEREKDTTSMDCDQEGNLPQFYTVTSDYPIVGEHIACGASGSVYKVNWLGMTCAKKHFNTVQDEDSMKEFMKEVNALATLNNPNIVKLLCTSDRESEISFLMEYMPMSLYHYIVKRWKNPEGTEPFTILAAIDLMQQIARGMEYLHRHDIVHRDLKSSNVLVAPSADEKLRDEGYADVKLADFGLAKMKVRDSTRPTREKIGTTKWRAPEAFASEKINWKKADVYSFAMTCSEILTGQQPFNSGPLTKLYGRIMYGERPDLPSTCPEPLARLLQAAWKTRPKRRPSFTEISEELTVIKRSLLKGPDPEGVHSEELTMIKRSLLKGPDPEGVHSEELTMIKRSLLKGPDPEGVHPMSSTVMQIPRKKKARKRIARAQSSALTKSSLPTDSKLVELECGSESNKISTIQNETLETSSESLSVARHSTAVQDALIFLTDVQASGMTEVLDPVMRSFDWHWDRAVEKGFVSPDQ